MTQKKSASGKHTSLYSVLAAHLRSLIAAGCDPDIVNEYSDLLRLLKSRNERSREYYFPHADDSNFRQSVKPAARDLSIMDASLDELLNIATDETTARKDLERIAIQRFGVPRGSMRSFSNRRILVEKLRALIRNELAHETIGRVARRQDNRTR